LSLPSGAAPTRTHSSFACAASLSRCADLCQTLTRHQRLGDGTRIAVLQVVLQTKLALVMLLVLAACGGSDDSQPAEASEPKPAPPSEIREDVTCRAATVGTWLLCPLVTNPEGCPNIWTAEPDDLEAACAEDLRCSYKPKPGSGEGVPPIGAGCSCTSFEGVNDWRCAL
jgi:hypothetical protein